MTHPIAPDEIFSGFIASQSQHWKKIPHVKRDFAKMLYSKRFLHVRQSWKIIQKMDMLVFY